MTATAQEALLHELAGLAVDDILALCYAFQAKPERLRLYLDALRKRGGERAQFASCLICFDLARQNEPTAQREFAFLADTMRGLAKNDTLVSSLVGGDDYLTFVWELCQAHLAEMDPRVEPEAVDASVEVVGDLDLISDEDFADLEIDLDTAAMVRQFDEAVEEFLGGRIGVPIYDPNAGFRVVSNRDVQRVEKFLLALDSLREPVPMSRGFRALALLFYGTHLRSKSLFGGINVRKQALLREGVAEFVQSGPRVWEVVGVLSSLHAAVDVWERIADVVTDYMQWIARDQAHAASGPSAYPAVERLLERQPSWGNRRTGLRSE